MVWLLLRKITILYMKHLLCIHLLSFSKAQLQMAAQVRSVTGLDIEYELCIVHRRTRVSYFYETKFFSAFIIYVYM